MIKNRFVRKIRILSAAVCTALLVSVPGVSSTVLAAESSAAETVKIPFPDFELRDQYGTLHKLADYQGKKIFINFWATWCPPCRSELPTIETLYEELQEDKDADTVILTIVAPGLGSEGSESDITDFLDENKYLFPVLMDEGGTFTMGCGITAYPTTFLVDGDGMVVDGVLGAMQEDQMRELVFSS